MNLLCFNTINSFYNIIMKSFDEYCKSLILSKYKLPIQEARTFEEFLDLNNLTEDNVSNDAIKFFYDYNINERFNRNVDEYSDNLLEMLSVQNNDKIKEKFEDDFDEIRKSGGCVWHVTSRKLKTTIKRTSLRPKVGKSIVKGGYRYFPERIYFLKNSKDIKNEIKEIAKTKGLSRYIIVKVDLKEHKFPLYKDTAYDTDGKVYTYTAIPPSMITIYDDVENL